jgi:hypothetical protein
VAIHIDSRFGVDLNDRDIWARNINAAKAKKGKKVPGSFKLEAAITNIHIQDTIRGSSSVTISVSDPTSKLIDSKFFDADADGKLDPIDVNYPVGSELWWRCTQVNPTYTGSGCTIELVFMERAAVHMMSHHGPLKTSRGKRTRAQFIKMLCDSVKAGGGIDFHSKELGTKQPQEKKKPEKKRKKEKDGGINPDADLTVKGHKASVGQIKQAERALDAASADDVDAPELAVVAMMCAAIGESELSAIPNRGGSNYWGVFQGNKDVFEIDDTEGMARCFQKGGKGFQGGGAIKLAHDHPRWSPGLIALTVEGSRSNFASAAAAENFYQQHEKEAREFIDAYGGGGGFVGHYRQQYNFEVGSTDDPNETFWDAASRLASQVNWPFFLDGQDAYFDNEMTLIRQKAAGVIRRNDAAVIGASGVWDMRQIATSFELTLICDPFKFRAGEVLKLEGFGSCSTGSTAKPARPGFWLIEEIDRERFEIFSRFTLKQPERPKREPRSEVVSRAHKDFAGGDIQPGDTPYDIINKIVLPMSRANGVPRTVEQNTIANLAHGPTQGGNRSDHQGPPKVAWAADMGMGTSHPTPQMDALARALIEKFDLPALPSPNATSGPHPENMVSTIRDGFRFQLIYRCYPVGAGNHYNHVHFGVKKTDAPTTLFPENNGLGSAAEKAAARRAGSTVAEMRAVWGPDWFKKGQGGSG